ncbi:MAG TPA: GNAT family N-acetyltransferase [Burkholderiaceae bacterium]|jgi:predicted GNAT family acetyltransferase|nr:GNAT family N-acetyltransferase [Burkholderiaceae bacterium]
MSRNIEHNTAAKRFQWHEDGQLCVLDYELHDGVMIITHTGVPESVGGRGIAADLARAALDTAAAQGWKVRPLCSYVAAYIRRQRGAYDDLLAS